MENRLGIALRAGCPGLAIQSVEEQRALRNVYDVAVKISGEAPLKVYIWTATKGLSEVRKRGAEIVASKECDFVAVWDETQALKDSVVVMFGMQYYFREPIVVRKALDSFGIARRTGLTYIFVGPSLELPPEFLGGEVVQIDFDLPDKDDLREILMAILNDNDRTGTLASLGEEGVAHVIDAALGLTSTEAENAFAMAVTSGGLSPEEICKEKGRAMKSIKGLQYYESDVNENSVGGMDNLKTWLRARRRAFSKEAEDFGLPHPRGVLMVGIPGTGKSLCAKAVSGTWQIPLLRLDAGALFGSLLGESEAAIRRVLATAEALAPCVLWVDEIEKAFGRSGGNLDGGTSSRVFGTLLTWMQERKKPVFVTATANDISSLPPEFLRKGRFDEIFFVDLPDTAEREEIFRVHLRNQKRDPANFDLASLCEASAEYSGAEIEQTIIEGMFTAFGDGRAVSTEDILLAIKMTTPISTSMSEQITALRRWGDERARRANTLREVPTAAQVATAAAGRMLR